MILMLISWDIPSEDQAIVSASSHGTWPDVSRGFLHSLALSPTAYARLMMLLLFGFGFVGGRHLYP